MGLKVGFFGGNRGDVYCCKQLMGDWGFVENVHLFPEQAPEKEMYRFTYDVVSVTDC